MMDGDAVGSEDPDLRLVGAVWRGDIEGVRASLDDGADVHFDDNRALFAAGYVGCDAILRLLIEHGADVRASDSRALVAAAHGGHLGVVCELVAQGADLFARDSLPFRYAASRDHDEMVGIMLRMGVRYGADIVPLVVRGRSSSILVIGVLLDMPEYALDGADNVLRQAVLRCNESCVRPLRQRVLADEAALIEHVPDSLVELR